MPQQKYSKNKIYAVLWQDASYTFEKEIPQTPPPLQLTTGSILEEKENFINISTNLNYFKGEGVETEDAVDGFIIPKSVIVKIKEVGELNV